MECKVCSARWVWQCAPLIPAFEAKGGGGGVRAEASLKEKEKEDVLSNRCSLLFFFSSKSFLIKTIDSPS